MRNNGLSCVLWRKTCRLARGDTVGRRRAGISQRLGRETCGTERWDAFAGDQAQRRDNGVVLLPRRWVVAPRVG